MEITKELKNIILDYGLMVQYNNSISEIVLLYEVESILMSDLLELHNRLDKEVKNMNAKMFTNLSAFVGAGEYVLGDIPQIEIVIKIYKEKE